MPPQNEQGQPRPAKKTGRSTSPRAVELRRLQNRVAQHNHRKRVRERLEEANGHEESNESQFNQNIFYPTGGFSYPQAPDQQQPPPNLQPQQHHHHGHSQQHEPVAPRRANSAIAIEGSGVNNHPPFGTNVDMRQLQGPFSDPGDPMATLFRPVGPFQQNPFAPRPNCTCNSATGPCPDHFEMMRAQVIAESTPSTLQSHPYHHSLEQAPNHDPHQASLDPAAFFDMSDPNVRHPFVDFINNNNVARPLPQAQAQAVPPPTSSGSSTAASRYATSNKDASSTDGSSSSAGASLTGGSPGPADPARGISAVLETVRSAGFQDFDSMVAAFYTSQFEKGSVPSMSQSASRSRRLKAMVQELHKNSSQWPRWEARGLQESTVESAAHLCLQEIEGVTNGSQLRPPQTPTRLHNELESVLTSLEQLLLRDGYDNHFDGHKSDDLRLPGQLEAVPDSMPFLWSLLTELVGSRGLHCDRIAIVVLALLLEAQRSQ